MNAVDRSIDAAPGRSPGWTPGHQVLPGVYAYDLELLPWRTTPRGTAREKAVRRDAQAGLFLGLIAFDPMSRSGVHQHRGTASSYFLSGELVDYQCTTRAGAVGIIEHIGIRNYPAYFARVYELLTPGGLFLNHGITHGKHWRRSSQTEFLQRAPDRFALGTPSSAGVGDALHGPFDRRAG